MIRVARGNSLTLTAEIMQGDVPYIYNDDDRVIFTVKQVKSKSATTLIQKTLLPTDTDAEGRILINLVPEDTINFREGDYFYDLALKSGDNFFTVVVCDSLVILPALSDKDDVTVSTAATSTLDGDLDG